MQRYGSIGSRPSSYFQRHTRPRLNEVRLYQQAATMARECVLLSAADIYNYWRGEPRWPFVPALMIRRLADKA